MSQQAKHTCQQNATNKLCSFGQELSETLRNELTAQNMASQLHGVIFNILLEIIDSYGTLRNAVTFLPKYPL